MEDEGLDELIQDLEGFGIDFEDAVYTTMQQIASELEGQLKRDAGTRNKWSKSGNWRRSIDVSAQRNRLSVSMLSYGYYQIFGVNGKKRSGAFGIPEPLAGIFTHKSPNSKFQFQKINHPGIFGLKRSADLLNDIVGAIITQFEKQDI